MDSTRRIDIVNDPGRTRAMAASAPVSQTGPLAVDALVENHRALAGSRTHARLVTRITVGDLPVGGPRSPVNIALAIDRSGSMEGEPLQFVKQACAHVVDLLTPDDILSIVTFEEQVDVIMPARRVTDPGLIKQHIARIEPGNTTNLFDGLYAAGAQAAAVALPNMVSRVLLLTDGEPTAGLRDTASIADQAAQLKQRGVAVTALGFGPEYNEELLATIAKRSGGNYHFIRRPEQIPDVFREEILGALGTVGRDVRLTLKLPHGTVVHGCSGSEIGNGPRSASIALPDLERGQRLTKVWDVEYTPRGSGEYRTAEVVLEASGTSGPLRAGADAVVVFVDDPGAVAAGADPDAAAEIRVADAGRELERTLLGMRTTAMSAMDATQALERTARLLAETGNTSAAAEVSEATQAFRRGDTDAMDKTLIGTIYELDRGLRS
jgi:Ca-activated chloride channel family protein